MSFRQGRSPRKTSPTPSPCTDYKGRVKKCDPLTSGVLFLLCGKKKKGAREINAEFSSFTACYAIVVNVSCNDAIRILHSRILVPPRVSTDSSTSLPSPPFFKQSPEIPIPPPSSFTRHKVIVTISGFYCICNCFQSRARRINRQGIIMRPRLSQNLATLSANTIIIRKCEKETEPCRFGDKMIAIFRIYISLECGRNWTDNARALACDCRENDVIHQGRAKKGFFAIRECGEAISRSRSD